MEEDKGQNMFSEVKLSRIPSFALLKSEFPQKFSGGLRQEFQCKDFNSKQLSPLSNPSTELTPYSKLFFKISNRNSS